MKKETSINTVHQKDGPQDELMKECLRQQKTEDSREKAKAP